MNIERTWRHRNINIAGVVFELVDVLIHRAKVRRKLGRLGKLG
jgi:hypothetical protein